MEPKQIEELRQRFVGKQEQPKSDLTVEQLNQLVTEQGNKVRQLKAEKAEKGVIDKEVALLKTLKQQLSQVSGDSKNVDSKKSSKSSKKKATWSLF